MKFSVAMIVKDEEKNLERTLIPLKELQKYIDTEIVIVDTGSTDSTIDIAKQYTNKIYSHKWNNDFASMRNISIGYCTGDWILVVDADEVLYDVKDLAELMKTKVINKYNAAFIKIVNFTKDTDNSIKNGAISPMLRLFKRGKVRYEGTVHEQPRITNPVLDLNIRFIHYGYNNNDYKLMEYKFKRNLDLLMNEFEQNPDDIYIIYQIAASYAMHNDYNDALKYIELAYKKAKPSIGNFIYVLDKYCHILNGIKDYPLLLEKSEEALNCEKFIDFYYYKGNSCYNLLKYDEAIKAYNGYIQSYEKFKNNKMVFSSSLSVLTRGLRDAVLYNLGICYFKTKKYEEALNTLIKLEDKDVIRNNINAVLLIIHKGKLYNYLNNINGLIDKYNYETVLRLIHKEFTVEELKDILKIDIEDENLKEILLIIKNFKENRCLNKDNLINTKKIIAENKIPYQIFVYYILNTDFKEIYSLIRYGKNTLEDILIKLCSNYFDFNSVVAGQLEKIKINSVEDILVKSILERAILLAKKLPEDEKKSVFLNYIADKYYIIIKSYNEKIINNSRWMFSSEDRFILELKDTLNYKYIDTLEYIKMLKDNININKFYIDYIKLLIEDDKEFELNNEIRALIPELISSIQFLINIGKYQEAYNTIKEGLALVKFDFDLMVLKYNLLLKFNYEKEAQECLRDIILYGDSEKVIKLINNL